MSQASAGAVDPGSRYYVKIDSTGDGVEDVAYRWVTASATVAGNARGFVGPADDPFFVDLGPVFDGLTIATQVRSTTDPGNQRHSRDVVAAFNATSPADDAKNFGAPALNPEPAP